MSSFDRIARLWMLDLRRRAFIEVGGTSPPRQIWRCVRNHLGTGNITSRGVAVVLSPGQRKEVTRRAGRLVADSLAADSLTI
jgi:hypothetical protein